MPNWKKVVTSGSSAELNSLKLSGLVNAGTDTDKFLVLDANGNIDYRSGVETLSDINPGGLVSGSSQVTISSTTGYTTFSSSIASDIANLDSVSNPTLQDVTDNGAITTNNITITGSLKVAATGFETQFAHLQGNSLDLGKAGATDTYLKLNGQNGFLKIGPNGSTMDIYTDTNFISSFTSGSTTSYINSYNLNGPAGQIGTYIGQSLQLINSYGGSGTSATFNLKHRAVGRIGPAGGSSVQYEYLTVQGANYTKNENVEVNLFGDIIRMSSTSGSFGQNPRVQVRQVGTEVYGNLYVDGSGITGMDGLISAAGAITGSDVKITGFNSVSASLADLSGTVQIGPVANGNTTLVSGDGVYDYVNPISASIATDIASLNSAGYVDVSSGGASNRIAIFADADSLKGDADVTYYSNYNPQSQVYDVWDDVNSEGIKSKTLTTQGIYVGQVGTNFTASIALEANVGPASFYTETKAVGFNTGGTQTNYPIHVDKGFAFFINYHLGDGANYRAGTITINTNYGSSMVFSETSTVDLGDTSAHTFSVGYSSGVMTLYMTTTGGCEGTMEVRRMVSI